MNLVSSFVRYIDVEIEMDLEGKWRLTRFYGELDRSRKNYSWQLLRTLSTHSNSSWVCLGDFNGIISNGEKQGENQ